MLSTQTPIHPHMCKHAMQRAPGDGAVLWTKVEDQILTIRDVSFFAINSLIRRRWEFAYVNGHPFVRVANPDGSYVEAPLAALLATRHQRGIDLLWLTDEAEDERDPFDVVCLHPVTPAALAQAKFFERVMDAS